MHFDLDRAAIRVESDAELIGRATIHFRRIRFEQQRRRGSQAMGLAGSRQQSASKHEESQNA
jgi:hypothetical protein